MTKKFLAAHYGSQRELAADIRRAEFLDVTAARLVANGVHPARAYEQAERLYHAREDHAVVWPHAPYFR
jgi:hypothetical protein